MKKAFVFAILLGGFSAAAYAQSEELKSAQTNIDSKNYIKALEDISKAKKAVYKLVSDNIASVLPSEFEGYKMIEDDGNDMGMSSGISVSKTYRKPVVKKEEAPAESNGGGGADGSVPDPADMNMPDPSMMGMDSQEPEINVMVTTDMMMAGEVNNAHSSSESGYNEEGVEPIRIKGYRAVVRKLVENDDSVTGEPEYSETAQVIVGGAFISVESRGTETGPAEKLAGLIDFAKLKSMIGE